MRNTRTDCTDEECAPLPLSKRTVTLAQCNCVSPYRISCMRNIYGCKIERAYGYWCRLYDDEAKS